MRFKLDPGFCNRGKTPFEARWNERGCLDYTSECLLQAANARVRYMSVDMLPVNEPWRHIVLVG